MKLRGQQWSFDSRDLMRAQCEHCTRLSTARELGVSGLKELIAQYYEKPDNLAIRFGMRFEERLEQELIQNLAEKIQKPSDQTDTATLDLMAQGVPVIYQGVLRGGSGAIAFSGRPDFLLRSDYRFEFGATGLTAIQVDGWTGGYTAWDAKLSQSAKPEYQVQVGLYVDVLQSLGLAAKKNHGLILGSNELAKFDADVLVSQLVEKRSEYLKQVFGFIDQDPQRLEDIGSLVCDASSYCDICEYPELCAAQRIEQNHLQLVANITKAQIESLGRSGIKTVAALAEFSGSTDKLSESVVEKLSLQANLQQKFYQTGQTEVRVIDAKALQLLNSEHPGDIFFDLEGFTFFAEPGGLEYLFGWVSIDQGEQFHWLWADDRKSEKEIFEKFVSMLKERLINYPDARIFHYANYEQAAHRRMAERFDCHGEFIEKLISENVFVDLYKVVKASIMTSEPKYSIKNLENFYTFKRSSDVKEAMGSMEYYDQYLVALDSDVTAAETLKRQVISYNQDDCVSTLALTRWLRSLSS
jgi:predicted RecB family nuclease